MNNLETRRYNMLLRVSAFATAHASDFPAASFGQQLFAAVNAAISELATHAAKQTSGAARESITSKAVARANLLEDLEAINRTAKAMALDMPGLEDKFRMPRSLGDTVVLNTARAFLTDATPLKAEFLKYAMAADFLEDLQADITAFETAIHTKNSTRSTKVSATASIDEALSKGMKAVQQLQAVVRNKYRNDAATLAAWMNASHVERSGTSTKSQPEAPPGDAPPPSTPPTPKP